MGGLLPGFGQPQPGYQAGQAPQPGYPAQQPGYPASAPQSGFPDPSQYQQSGFPDPSQYQQSGFPDPSQQQSASPERSQYVAPGSSDQSRYPQSGSSDPAQHQQSPSSPAPPPPGQQPGYYGVPQSGYQGQPWQGQSPSRPRRLFGSEEIVSDTLEGAIGEAVLGAATKALGGVIGRRMRRAFEEKVVPAMAARQESMTRNRMSIAERHPDLRACLNDQVVFLAGGTRTIPLAQAMAVRTLEQSDALVAQLRG
jgi:hypothetical protein